MASLIRSDLRTIGYYNFKRQLSTDKCMKEMRAVFGNNCPSLRTIQRWYLQYQCNKFNLDDDLHLERPAEVSRFSREHCYNPKNDRASPANHV